MLYICVPILQDLDVTTYGWSCLDSSGWHKMTNPDVADVAGSKGHTSDRWVICFHSLEAQSLPSCDLQCITVAHSGPNLSRSAAIHTTIDGRLKRYTLLPHSSGDSMPKLKMLYRFGVCQDRSFWFAEGCLLTMSSHNREKNLYHNHISFS